MMPWARRSVMPRLAAMSPRLASGSWAMCSRTRAWLVRKPQSATQISVQLFLEKYCWLWWEGTGRNAAGGGSGGAGLGGVAGSLGGGGAGGYQPGFVGEYDGL